MPLLLGASQQAWPCATTTPASPAHIATVGLAPVKVVGVISMTTSYVLYVLRLQPGAVSRCSSTVVVVKYGWIHLSPADPREVMHLSPLEQIVFLDQAVRLHG